jgi:YVTN family beta-propeller protein
VVHTAANRISVLDTGLRLEDHGDHQDARVSPAHVRGTIAPGRRPIDFWTDYGFTTVHNDDDGALAVFDDERLEVALDYTEIKGEGTGHNNAVVLGGDTVLLSYAAEGRVTAYGLDNSVKARFEGCVGTHGWTARTRTQAASGCVDGVLVYTHTAEGVTAHKVAEPAGSPADARVSTMTSSPRSEVFVGNFGQGLALLKADASVLTPVVLPAAPVKFAFSQAGDTVVVLTADGAVQGLNPNNGETLWRTSAAVQPLDPTAGSPRPSMALGESVAYVSNPPAGEVVVLDVQNGSVIRRVAVGGTPTNLAVAAILGVKH